MATKKLYESATVAATWWVNALKNGLTSNLPLHLQFIQKLSRQTSSYTEKDYLRLGKQITITVSRQLKNFGLITLYTKTYPEGLLKECAKDAFIFYKIDNPFPENVIMQVTKDSVIVKANKIEQVLFNNHSIER